MTYIYYQYKASFFHIVKEVATARKLGIRPYQQEEEQKLRELCSDIIINNNHSWINRGEYISVFRSRTNNKLYCYTLHDNNQNIVANHMENIDRSPIVNHEDFSLVFGGPDYSDVIQTAVDFASFLSNI